MNRPGRLAVAVVSMAMAGNLQYAWTMCVQPLVSERHWTLSETQWGFTVFIAAMTWTMPLCGAAIDRFGVRALMAAAAFLCAAGWSLLGYAATLPHFYFFYAVAGVGSALVYCCCTAFGLRLFPDKRGMASGLIVAGYGSGAAVFNPLFGCMILAVGCRLTFLFTGVVLGVAILIAGRLLGELPPAQPAAAPASGSESPNSDEFGPRAMLRTPRFYTLFLMMMAMGVGGLMTTAQIAPIAREFHIGPAALAISLALNPLANGLSRIMWGWISDRLGRRLTMCVAFSLNAIFLASVALLGAKGDVWFVITTALVFLTWGELYALFPAALADNFGVRHASANYGLLYLSKSVASILSGGLAAHFFEGTGSWSYAFYVSAALALCSGLAALRLGPMALPSTPAQVIPVGIRTSGQADPLAP